MIGVFGPSWKTTISGLLLAIFVAIQPIFTAQGFDIAKDWKNLLMAAFIASFGFVAKDKNVTGGDTLNKPNDPAKVDQAGKVSQ